MKANQDKALPDPFLYHQHTHILEATKEKKLKLLLPVDNMNMSLRLPVLSNSLISTFLCNSDRYYSRNSLSAVKEINEPPPTLMLRAS